MIMKSMRRKSGAEAIREMIEVKDKQIEALTRYVGILEDCTDEDTVSRECLAGKVDLKDLKKEAGL